MPLLVSNGMRRHANADLNLLERFLVAHDDARHNLGLRTMKSVLDRAHVLKMLCHQFHELLVLQVTGCANNEIARSETLAVETEDGITLEGFHGIFGSQDRLAQRVIPPEVLGKDFVDEIVGAVFVHFDFFEDHAPFTADVLYIKCGIEDEVAEDIHGDREMLVQNLDVEANALLGGKGVHVSTDGVDLSRNVLGGSMLGSLENHVLDEMRDAIPLRILIARSGLDPNTNRGRTDMLHLLGDYGQAVGQQFALDIAYFF